MTQYGLDDLDVNDLDISGLFKMLGVAVFSGGNWTPNVGGSATYTTQVGKYIKITTPFFTVVVAWFNMTINVIGTGSTSLLSGLPVPSANNGLTTTVPVSYWTTLNSTQSGVVGEISPNNSTISFNTQDAANQDTITHVSGTIFKSGAGVRGIAVYLAA